MTVETAPAPAADTYVDASYVRKTVDGVTTLAITSYDSVKNLNEYTKSIAEVAEGRLGWVAGPLSNFYISAVPVIDSVDERVDGIVTAASSLKSRATEGAENLKSAYTETTGTLKTKATETAASFKSKATETAETFKVKATETVDTVKVKAVESYSGLKKYSATQGKEMIHIDLIAYAEEVLDNANNTAKPAYLAVQKKLAVAISNVTTSVSALQDAVSKRVKEAELQEKLEVAIERVRELAKYGKSYVDSNLLQFRAFALEQSEALQTSYNKSITYVMAAPEHIHEYNQIVMEKSGVDLEKHAALLKERAEEVIHQANTLIQSIMRVVGGVEENHPKAE